MRREDDISSGDCYFLQRMIIENAIGIDIHLRFTIDTFQSLRIRLLLFYSFWWFSIQKFVMHQNKNVNELLTEKIHKKNTKTVERCKNNHRRHRCNMSSRPAVLQSSQEQMSRKKPPHPKNPQNPKFSTNLKRSEIQDPN